ncbi:GNAT family N-acetyltransferase [Stenotrophomonas sp. AB1(2024)]|uniref:GNAT family N-acetyltransferase n=1 Tax=Stenotrophomonas sp. AB1(2024) TaxID=3132215 RepID=UPI0030A6E672
MNAQKHFHHAALDSRRFDIQVSRGTLESIDDARLLVEEIEADQADLVIFRVPAGETSLATALQRRGHQVIHADTLVYYSAALDSTNTSPELQVRPATAEHRQAIAEIAAMGFANYRAHYSANPLLPRDLILAGYVEWALSRLEGEREDSQTWVVSEEGTVAGFATCDIGPSTVEIVLNAVHPDYERRGLYGKLLRHIQHHYTRMSMQELIISTQIWNYTVQRQWSRAGLRLFKAYDTYHLDRRLGLKEDLG